MKIIAKKSLNKESKTVYWMPPRSLETSKSLSKKVMPGRIRAWLKSSQEDSLVNRSVLPEKEEEVTMKEICGRSLCKLLKSFNQDLLSWKTSQGFFHLDISKTYFADYMKSGIMQDGQCWELKMWERRTRGIGCGLLHISTPTSSDVTAGEGRLKGDYKRYRGEDIATYALRKTNCVSWPTPRSNTAMSATIIENANPDRYPNLETVMKKREPQAVGGQLNADWVEWLMMFPIGWTSLEPIKEMIWLDWSVDPADLEKPEMIGTIRATQAIRSCDFRKGRKPSPEEFIETSGPGTGPIPRVATNIKDRVNRLKALGNGQVPLCVAIAWEILTTYDGKKKII